MNGVDFLESVGVYFSRQNKRSSRIARGSTERYPVHLSEWSKMQRYCIYCRRQTRQRYYDDYRPNKPYAYYQCSRCHRCMYRCMVCKRYTADRGGIENECTCVPQEYLDALQSWD